MSLWKINTILFFVMAMFGGGFVATKYLLFHLRPESVALLRVLAGFFFFLPLAIRYWPKDFSWKQSGLRLVVCGLTGYFLNQFLFVLGMKRTLASHSTVIVAGIPVLTLLFSALLKAERPSFLRWMGFFVSLCGIAYLSEVDAASWSNDLFVGDVLVFLNASFYAFYLVFYRPLSQRYSALWLTWSLFGVGVLALLPFGVPSLLAETWSFQSSYVVPALVYVLIFQTILPYFVITYLLRFTTSSHVAQGIYIQPIIAITGASILLDEPLSSRLLLSAALVLSGVWISQNRRLGVQRRK